MKYAVIKTGGKQYLVTSGQTLAIEKLLQKEGDEIKMPEILMVADESGVKLGNPTVAGATVKATVIKQFRDKKIEVVKYKPKVRYRKRAGHRQHLTSIKIGDIT